jgi:hypothetical protein
MYLHGLTTHPSMTDVVKNTSIAINFRRRYLFILVFLKRTTTGIFSDKFLCELHKTLDKFQLSKHSIIFKVANFIV